jgi:hypothetical protein
MRAVGVCALALLAVPVTNWCADSPVVPVGLDAYRMWDRWPYQRIGVRAYMRSTYDREGGNEGADASHFLYQLSDTFNTTLDVEGAGVLYFARYNHWHGSPWHYEVDGNDYIVQETSTADPNHPVPNSVFIPQSAFPSPLALTWSTTKGADLSWVPIAFENSFRMAYERTHYGTGYYIYHQFVPGTPLSSQLIPWTPQDQPTSDVIDLISSAGSDLTPAGCAERSGVFDLPASGWVTLWNARQPATMIRCVEFTVPRAQAVAFARANLQVYWDDLAHPSINTPLGFFFGSGSFYNRSNKQYLVKALPVNVIFSSTTVTARCFFPMPFFKSARIRLGGNGQEPISGITWRVRYQSFTGIPNHVGYFHATYTDHPNPILGQDLVLLDTSSVEGGGDWSGTFVGTSIVFSHNAFLGTLEGDPRFFFDDSLTPQAYGTGTEEWNGGGDYWGGENMTLAFVGHPTGAASPQLAHNDEDKIETAYRFLLADLMPFGKRALIRLEHGGENETTEHYETVAFWYGIPAPSLIETDQLKIADTQSEGAHNYYSPEASLPYSITSRYEWGVDTVYDTETYPPHTDTGRVTKGVSEFDLALEPRNLGVVLRRKLDYEYPNQRAEVYVKEAHSQDAFQYAGIWYLAGSNTCVYSNPLPELGPTQHTAQTSNRRFRDDEFLIGCALTEGRAAIRVRIVFTPVVRPLCPGFDLPPLGWSEIKYTAYSVVMPRFYGRFPTKVFKSPG